MEKVVGLQKKLFDDPSYTVTDDEILAVCSGKFTNTQGSQNLKKHGSLNQTSELMELCSGAFFTQLVDMKKLEVPKCNNQISDNSSQDIVLTFDEEINLEGSAEPSSLVKQFSNSILNSDSSSENNSKNLMGESLEMANQTPINMQLIKKGDIAESQLLDKVSNKITSPLVKTLVTNIAHSNKSNDTPLASINQSMNLIKQVNGEQDSDCLKYFKVASSSDDDEEAEKSQSERKILKKRKVQKLVLSDDEADNPTRSSEESETEHAEDFLGYDSDENEIKLSKREINQEASKFLENEAELSESDWDSADENEEDMDRLEYEDGDADEIDEDIVKNQLDRLHMKQQMDDDKREVRMLQELLFDDGDLYSEGVSRQKRFKWKNINDSEDLNESNVNNDPAEEIHTEVDTAYEIEMRKLRHEKQKFLEDKEKRFGELIEEDFNDSQLIKSKLKIVSARSLSSNLKEEQNVLQFHLDNNCETTNKTSITLDASSCTEKLSFSNVRGSFLARGNDTLVRIAQNLPETSKNSLNLKSRGNFVFEHISPSVTRSTNKNSEQGNTNTPRHKGRKRKFTLNQTPRTAKKLKTDEKIRGNKLF